MDLKAHFGLTDENARILTPTNCPAGTRFVNAPNTKVMVVDAWEDLPNGNALAWLHGSPEGTAEIDMSEAGMRKFEIKKPNTVYVIPEVAEVASADDDFGDVDATGESTSELDDDFGDELGVPGEVAPLEEDDVEDESGVADAAGVATPVEPDPEVAPVEPPVPVIEENFLDEDDELGETTAAPVEEAAPVVEAPAPVVQEANAVASGLYKVVDDGIPGEKSKAVFICAGFGMTCAETAQYMLDQGLYRDIVNGTNNVRRVARKMNTAGYGIWLVENDERLMLSEDGKTPILHQRPNDGYVPASGEAARLADNVRANVGMESPTQLPAPLAAALSGLENPELLLSPKQVQGITQIAYGLALLLGGK